MIGIGTFLLAWLMISSIHLVQPTSSQGGSSSNQQGTDGPGSGGSGSGGSGSSGGYNFDFSLFRLPSFNFPFKIPNWFSWFNFGNHSNSVPPITGTFPAQGDGYGTGGGGGAGSSGQGGQTGSGNSNSGNPTKKDPPQFVIPPELLIIVVVIALILAGTAFAVANRKSFSKGTKQVAVAEPTMLAKENPPDLPTSVFDPSSELFGEEKVAPLAGWGRSGFIKPDISEDLPLIWSLDDPLKIETPQGAKLAFSGNNVPLQSENSADFTSLNFSFPCNQISGELNGVKDEKWIRAVHYDEDVTKLFRLNLINSSGIDLKSKTAREIARHLVAEHPELIRDKGSLFGLTRIFERAFYGRKVIRRKEYESFLMSLAGALNSPKVIICGPRDREAKSDRQ